MLDTRLKINCGYQSKSLIEAKLLQVFEILHLHQWQNNVTCIIICWKSKFICFFPVSTIFNSFPSLLFQHNYHGSNILTITSMLTFFHTQLLTNSFTPFSMIMFNMNALHFYVLSTVAITLSFTIIVRCYLFLNTHHC